MGIFPMCLFQVPNRSPPSGSSGDKLIRKGSTLNMRANEGANKEKLSKDDQVNLQGEVSAAMANVGKQKKDERNKASLAAKAIKQSLVTDPDDQKKPASKAKAKAKGKAQAKPKAKGRRGKRAEPVEETLEPEEEDEEEEEEQVEPEVEVEEEVSKPIKKRPRAASSNPKPKKTARKAGWNMNLHSKHANIKKNI